MLELLFQRLTRYTELTRQDRERIEACAWTIDNLPANTDLMREGSKLRLVNVMLDGWACCYKRLEDGRRQITALLLPGDMCAFLLHEVSHPLATLTPSTVARIPEREMLTLLDEHPALMRAFRLDMLVNAEVQREWIVSFGRRTAIERIAHLLCELVFRLRAVGHASQDRCDLLITQTDLGDALGLSAVHVNRMLHELRARGLIKLQGKRLTIPDEPALQALALFDPAYLHLQRPGFETLHTRS